MTTTTTPSIDRSTSPTSTLAALAAAVLTGFAAFQLALAAGAPWGGLVWGGATEGALSDPLRVAGVMAAVALSWMALVLLARGGVTEMTGIVPSGRLKTATWAIAGFMILNTLGNIASGNPFEQFVLAPITGGLAAAAAFLAVRGVDPQA